MTAKYLKHNFDNIKRLRILNIDLIQNLIDQHEKLKPFVSEEFSLEMIDTINKLIETTDDLMYSYEEIIETLIKSL